MKKKSFFNGINAKMALAIVALSGALLTGCYKDDGLDMDAPIGETVLPEATYTLNGTVIDASTMQNLKLDAAAGDYVKVNNVDVTLTNGSFTVAVKAETNVIAVKVKGYNEDQEFTRSVNVAPIKPGQSAVYTQTIGLKPNAVVTEEVAKYNIKVQAYGGEAMALLDPSRYEATITKEGVAVAGFEDLEYGVYTLNVVDKVAAGAQKTLQDFTTLVSLNKVYVPKGDPNLTVVVSAYMPLIGDMTEYTMLFADFTNASNGNLVNVVKAWVAKDGVDVPESIVTNTSHFAFKVKKEEVANYKLFVTYERTDGSQNTVTKNFADDMTSLGVLLNTNAQEGSTPIVPGQDTEIAGTDGDVAAVKKGTTITLPDGKVVDFADVEVNIQRLVGEEASDEEAMRVYEGTPDGIKFSEPIAVKFNDIWANQLGTMKLVYEKDGKWGDSEGDVVRGSDGVYTMNISHFSKFKAVINSESSVGTSEEVKDAVVETVVGKKNDTENAITVTVKYNQKKGTEISSIEEAATSAGFTDSKANAVVTSVIKAYMEEKGIVAEPFTTVSGEENKTIDPWTCLEKVTTQQVYLTTVYTFTINEKPVTVTVKTADHVIVGIETYTFGHGHGHSHGHGNDNLSGGGIIDAE